MCALYSTSQLERAAKYILKDQQGKSNENLASIDQGFGNGKQTFVIGTKDRPLHVINDGSSGSGGNWSRKFTTAVNVAIVAAIIYSVLSINETTKLGGMQSN